MARRGGAALARGLDTQTDMHPGWDPDRIDDDVLRLVFIAAHPALPEESRIVLTLRVIGGLSTDEIARAFLVSTATVAQRIVRAKKALADAGVPFEVPDRAEYPRRWIRDELCTEALRLGRLRGSYLLPSVRGELLARLARYDEAAAEFEAAASKTDNERERDVLADKAARARSSA